jgi:hypothetical protein
MLVGILHLGLQCLCNIEFGWLVSVGFIVLKDFYRSVLVTCRVRFQTDYLGMLFEKAIVACYCRSDAELLVRVSFSVCWRIGLFSVPKYGFGPLVDVLIYTHLFFLCNLVSRLYATMRVR